MQVQHIGYRIRGFYRVAALGYLWEMAPKDAQRRFEILRFCAKGTGLIHSVRVRSRVRMLRGTVAPMRWTETRLPTSTF
jgi:hypothetical protein